MSEAKERIKKAQIILPGGKVLLVLPAEIPVDYAELERIEKEQKTADLGMSNGIPATISLTAASGDLLQSFKTTDKFSLYINYIEGIVVLRAEHILARTFGMSSKLINTKIVSKVIIPLKNFIAARFNYLALPPENPENGQMHENEIWVADQVVAYNTRNVDDIEILGRKGVSLISPEEGKVLFTVLFQNGELSGKNVSTFMIVSTERLSNYLKNSIDVPLS